MVIQVFGFLIYLCLAILIVIAILFGVFAIVRLIELLCLVFMIMVNAKYSTNYQNTSRSPANNVIKQSKITKQIINYFVNKFSYAIKDCLHFWTVLEHSGENVFIKYISTAIKMAVLIKAP